MIELERGPRKNPDYAAEGKWMYYPKGYFAKTPEFKANFPTWNQEAFTNMADGEKVIYKFHICPALGDYLTRTRKIITNFLHKNHIMHKTVGTNKGTWGENSFEDNINNEKSTQYGKTFTVYTGTLEEFYIIAKGIKELVKKYSINGIPKSKFEELKSNMMHEKVVPDTNNVLYYTVEKATTEAVYKALRAKKPGWIKDDGIDSFGNFRMTLLMPDGEYGQVGTVIGKWKNTEGRKYKVDGTPAMYLSSSTGSGYALREVVMDHYMGEGPVDFLWTMPASSEIPFMKDSEMKVSEMDPIGAPTGLAIDRRNPYEQLNHELSFVESPSIGGVAEMTRRGFSGVTSDTDDDRTMIEFVLAYARPYEPNMRDPMNTIDFSNSFISSENIGILEKLVKTHPENVRIGVSRGGHAALWFAMKHTNDTAIGVIQKFLWDLAQNFKRQRPWAEMITFEEFKTRQGNMLGIEWDDLSTMAKDFFDDSMDEWTRKVSPKTGYSYGTDEDRKYDESIFDSLTAEEKKKPDPSKLKALFDSYIPDKE